MKPVVSPAATADIERLHTFLADKNRAAADRAIGVLIAAVQSLESLPERGRRLSGPLNIRELIAPFGRSFYVLRYAYSAKADEIVVLRVWHGRETRK